MKRIIIALFMLAYFSSCSSQDKVKNFIKIFKPLSLPIENVYDLSNSDTLNGKFTNDIIIRSQKKPPQYIDKQGNLKTIKQYYGLYPEEPDDYLMDVKNKEGKWEEKRLFFYPKVIPVGRIELNPKYETLIIKVIGFETTFFDLWNFSPEGKALSVVCLFWGMRDDGPKNEKVTYEIVKSKISKKGEIIWHENADGQETFRTYILNDQGIFKIIKEETKGEADF